MRKIIKNGEIVTATEQFKGDICIENGVVQELALTIEPRHDDQIIDASGLFVLPGGIDAHTHLELPFMGTVSADDFETGTRAALCGGTTTIIDFVIPNKGQDLKEAVEGWKEKARKSCCDYGFHIAITYFNDNVAAQIPALVADGIPSFKAFLAYKGALQISDDELLRLMEAISGANGMLALHAENGDVVALKVQKLLAEGKTDPMYHPISRPNEVEAEATHRAIVMASMLDVPIFFVHMTCKEALAEVKEARARGQLVYAETCPQYLLHDDSTAALPNFEGAKYIMSPPIRKKEDQEALWLGLQHGFIQTIGTDHCSFNFKGQKEMGLGDFSKIPNGSGGVGDRMWLMYTYGVGKKRFNLNKFVEVTATNPAKLFGLYPQKGTISPGSDADIVLWDPNARHVISKDNMWHNVDHTIWEGFEIQGMPRTVLLRGQIAFDNGQFLLQRGCGNYLKRKPFAPLW